MCFLLLQNNKHTRVRIGRWKKKNKTYCICESQGFSFFNYCYCFGKLSPAMATHCFTYLSRAIGLLMYLSYLTIEEYSIMFLLLLTSIWDKSARKGSSRNKLSQSFHSVPIPFSGDVVGITQGSKSPDALPSGAWMNCNIFPEQIKAELLLHTVNYENRMSPKPIFLTASAFSITWRLYT
jgi:hypothetical protein